MSSALQLCINPCWSFTWTHNKTTEQVNWQYCFSTFTKYVTKTLALSKACFGIPVNNVERMQISERTCHFSNVELSSGFWKCPFSLKMKKKLKRERCSEFSPGTQQHTGFCFHSDWKCSDLTSEKIACMQKRGRFTETQAAISHSHSHNLQLKKRLWITLDINLQRKLQSKVIFWVML